MRIIGDNTSNPGNDCANNVWVDQFKYGGYFNGFGSHPNDGYDAEGWPKRVDSQTGPTTTQISRNAKYPAGEYPLLYEGEGEIRLRGGMFNGTGTPKIVCDGSPKTLTLAAPNNPGVILVDFWASNAANHLRNVRLRLPGYAGDRAFTDPFLDQQAYRTFKRFLDWSAVNNTTLKNWTDSGRIGHGFGITMRKRICEEYQQKFLLEMLERTGVKLIWWCLWPHFASYGPNLPGNWVDGFANLVRNGGTIDGFHVPALPVPWEMWGETSNETWNSGFNQQAQMNQLRNQMIDECTAWQQANPPNIMGGFEFISHIKAAAAQKMQEAFAGSGHDFKTTVMQQGLIPSYMQLEINNFKLPNLFIGESNREDNVPNINSNIPIHVGGGGIYVHPGTATGQGVSLSAMKNTWNADKQKGRDDYFAALPPYISFLKPPLAQVKVKVDSIPGARFMVYEAGMDANSFYDNSLQPFLQDCFNDARKYDATNAVIAAIPDGTASNPVGIGWYLDCQPDGNFFWGAYKSTGQAIEKAHIARALNDYAGGSPPIPPVEPTTGSGRRLPRGLMRLKTTVPAP